MQLDRRTGRFFAAVRRFPHLGAHVHKWLCDLLGNESEEQTFKHLHLLPNLKVLLMLPWSPALAKLAPPPQYSPPALDNLFLKIKEASDEEADRPVSTLASWFSLGSLRQVQFFGPIASPFVAETVLACLPDSFESFLCDQEDDGSLLSLLLSTARFKDLKTLDVCPFDSTTTAAARDFNPLALFPALTTFN